MATRFGGRSRVDSYVTDWVNVPKIIVSNAASDVTSGGWRTITWNSSGSLTLVDTTLDIEYLIVAGGGGGGSTMTGTPYTRAGGGGAGGDVVSNVGGAKLSLGPGIYNAVVGAGGTGEIAGSTRATIGGTSEFSDVFAIGGGGGGGRGRYGMPGANSGGHGGKMNDTVIRCLAGGFDGGLGLSSAGDASPGGGAGDGAAGGNANSTTYAPGAGGAGTANSITGSSVTYGGGGGGGYGGAGGSGGGASGTTNAVGGAGTANTGGGGGGAGSNTSTSYNGGAGGSGKVIIRWVA